MKVIIPDTGEEVFVFSTPEMSAELKSLRDSECEHGEYEWRCRPTSNDGYQVRKQCLDCGYVLGGSRKQSPDDDKLACVDQYMRTKYEKSRKEEYDQIFLKYALLQRDKENSWFYEHKAYLNSSEWRCKRDLVLKRADGLCEGCRVNFATVVHHLKYDNWKNEFLFELVAVCRPCHDRLHQTLQEPASEVED